MTTPEPAEYDVAVVGGGLGGMLAAAMLGRAGRRVVLFEREATLGGRLRSFDVDGGFVVDAGAYLWPDAHFSEAMERAGAASFRTSEIPPDRLLRLFVEGEGGARMAFPFPGRKATPKMLRSAAAALAADEPTYERLCALWASLNAYDDAQVESLRGVTLAEALPALGLDAALADAFRRNVMVYGTYDPDNASMAECIELGRRPRDRRQALPVVAGDNPGGGVRALVGTLESALRDVGVEVRLATTVEKIDSTGCVVSWTSASGSGVLDAQNVVINVPVDQSLAMLGATAVPEEFSGEAARWSVVGGVVAVAFGFRGRPHLRDGGAEDDFPGWTRLLVGPDRGFGGGMLWTSLHSPANAPAGCEVLQAMRLSPHSDVENAERVAEIHDSFDRMLREIYSDVDELLLWTERWTTSDGTEYMVCPARRPPVVAPWMSGLYFVGETTDVPAVQMDAAALSALRCADAILGCD